MQLDPSTPINLNINVEVTNAILHALSQQPYERVAGIIAMIQQQAAPQIQAAQAPANVPVPAPEQSQ